MHRVLEATDFAAADLDAELTARIARGAAAAARSTSATRRRRWRPACARRSRRRSARSSAALRLRDVAAADRLDELGFELPLAGGDRPSGWLTLARIAAVLRDHLPAGTRWPATPTGSQDPALRQSVRGYLTGQPRPGGAAARIRRARRRRFAVLDYKTNWLGGPDEPLTAWHYRPAALAAEMQRHHYALQALLYTVALHRYLRWRLPGYDPARNLAGVALPVPARDDRRRRAPTVDGQPCGVFAWRPPAGAGRGAERRARRRGRR